MATTPVTGFMNHGNAVPQLSYFGKVPSFADFVRHRATSPTWQAFDRWLQHGVRLWKNGPARRGGDPTSGPVSFLFAPDETDTMLLGVMQPSRDKAGRFYPFILGHELKRPAYPGAEMARLPVAAQAFQERAAFVVEEAVAGTRSYQELEAALPSVGEALEGLRPVGYEAYVRGTSFRAFAEAVWEHFEDSRKYVLFKNLMEAVAPVREAAGRGEALRLSYGLVFPVPAGGEAGYAASFWWELCARLVGGEMGWPSCFWPVPDADAERSQFVLYMRPPGAGAFAALLKEDVDNEAVCMLERIEHGSAIDATLAIPPEVGRLIESEAVTLGEVLEQMGG